MGLTLAMLYVKDLPKMAAFYEEVLVLRPIVETRSDTWIEFEAGAMKFALHAIPAHIADGIHIASPPVPLEDTPFKLYFEVESIEQIQSLGVTIIERPWGGFDLVDPEGNISGLTLRSMRAPAEEQHPAL